MEQGASLATPANPLVQRQGSRRSTSDGKQWQENPWCRPRNLGHTRTEDTGRTCTQAKRLSTSASSTRLHPEIGWKNDAPARNPHYERPSPTGIAFSCTGSVGGNPCLPQLLWVSP